VEDVEKSGQRQRKLLYRGVLLETVFLNRDHYRSAEGVLSSPISAHNLAVPGIISDPTGKLTELQQAVAQGYTQRRWVKARCELAKQELRTFLDKGGQADSATEMRGSLWWTLLRFGDVIAAAHLRSPTIRRCFAQLRELLGHQNQLGLHESVLQVFGSAHISPNQVEFYLLECLKAFDRAVEVIQTPFWGYWQLSPCVRPYVVEGTYEMLHSGHHREAMWWVYFNHWVSNNAFQNDAPESEKAGFQAGYDGLLAELGLLTLSDCQRRLELAKSVAVDLFRLVDEVILSHPDIKA
jgi:hypothetical protein